ncbi:MAG TPA: glucose 1-dehydrogenase [Mycobacteriales bacterium]|nr:glucose 1-dehydrogenase [Mycobacteriales bacterium]
MRFENPSVIVTGAGSGIGAAMAERFTAEGASVVIADIDGDKAAATAERIPHARAETVDVTDGGQVRALIENVGTVDVLVNNATMCTDTPFAELTEAEWARDVDVNMKGAFLMSQSVLPGMVRQQRGAIVNIASVNGVSYFGNEAYSAAKAGLLSLTRSLAVRYGRHGIRCNAVVPGTIATPIWKDRLAANPDVLTKVRRWYPLGRVGTPDDVASAVLFLASDDASWITGAALPVDGGVLAGNLEFARELTGDELS